MLLFLRPQRAGAAARHVCLSALLLSILSGIAVVYTAVALFVVPTWQ